jgi:hypothetical protein
MMLKNDPFALIFSAGDVATQLTCLEFFGLADSLRAKECLLALVRQQRSDGAHPSGFDSAQWGMLETVRHTLLLLQVGLPADGLNVHSAVRFVLRQQRADGGWCENPDLALPPERFWLSTQRSITWLTADVVELLRQAGSGEDAGCQAALSWLRAMQNRRGAWPSRAWDPEEHPDDSGDPDATSQIGFLMGDLYGQDEPVYARAQELFEGYLDQAVQEVERGYRIRPRDGQRVDLDVYDLTHLLLSWPLDPPRRIRHGYDTGDARVRRMMEALVGIQRADGGWRPFWAEESCPVYTVLAVKALVLSGALEQEKLQAAVSAYAA